jgi:gas vesicle protein
MAEDSKVHHLGWFLAGLGVGALVGILYAPKSGRETREKIANGAREGSEFLRARTQQAAEKVSVLVEKGKEQAGDFVDRGRAQ